MSWLEDLSKETIYQYRDEVSEELVSGTKEELSEFFGHDLLCEPGEEAILHAGDGSIKYIYAGFLPRELGITTRVSFEKNGRVGLRTKFADGKQYVRSKTKELAMEGKGTDSILTRQCREASKKAEEKIVHDRAKATIKHLSKQAQMAKKGK